MTFTPVVRTSHSIPKSLLEFAKERKIESKLLDFELLSFETLIRRKDCDDFEIVEDIQTISQEDLLEEETTLIQEYSIQIKPRQKRKINDSIQLSLGVNKLKTKAVLTIAKGSVFTKRTQLLTELRTMVWEKKLRAGLFIGIFEPKLAAQLQKLVAIVPYNKPLAKELKFNVALGIEPVAPTDAKLQKLYLQKEGESIIDGVDTNELIARYIKEKRGKDGRACNGKYITVRAPKTLNMRPKIDPHTIVEKEHAEYIEYFASDNGYVVFANNELRISKTLKLEGADFKSSATIDAGDDQRDISVHIQHKKSHSEDAIGSGVRIDVKELNVEGSVGSNVTIATNELTVDAQTHKNSKIEVSNQANVKLHRGDMVANDAHIDMLETGKISAHNSIHIKKMLGGEAIAPVVKVDELLSNSTITASDLIEIHSLGGQNNHLIINPDAIESHHKDIATLKEQITKQTKELQEFERDFEKRYAEHTAQIKRIQTFQARIKHATQAGKAPMKQDMIRIKMFKQESQKLSAQKEQLALQQQAIEEMQKKLDAMYEREMDAKIISKSPYDGHTKVTFIDSQTSQEISARPEGIIHTISLTRNNKGEKVLHYS